VDCFTLFAETDEKAELFRRLREPWRSDPFNNYEFRNPEYVNNPELKNYEIYATA